MTFEGLIGNTRAKRYLEKYLTLNAIPHLLLFSGIEGIGKKHFALEFAKAQLKQDKSFHPDISLLKVEGKAGLHSIQSMRKMIEEMDFSPFEAEYKIIIIDDCDKMLPTSANALLKSFEEPKRTKIILITSRTSQLLPTILSRAQVIRFDPIDTLEIADYLQKTKNITKDQAEKIAYRSKGSLGYALDMLENTFDFEDLLFSLVSKEHSNFYELSSSLKQLCESIDAKKKEYAEHIVKDTKDLPANIRNQIEQEYEGELQKIQMTIVDKIFHDIYDFFRDVQLVALGSKEQLFYEERKNEILDLFQNGNLISLSQVHSVLQKARLSIERSIPMQTVFEALFLELEMIKI